VVYFYSLSPLFAGSVTTPTLADGAVTEVKITLANNTTNNASTTKHGFLKILDNVATNFLNGQGNWAVPSGSGKMDLIEHKTLSGAAYPSFTGATIPNYKYLLLIFRISDSAGSGTLGLHFNNDGGNNYNYKNVADTTWTKTTGTSQIRLAEFSNNKAAMGFLLIETERGVSNYIHAVGVVSGTQNGSYDGPIEIYYAGAANLTSLDFLTNAAGNANGNATLYGFVTA